MWGPESEPPGNEGADSHQLPLPEPDAQVTREEAGHKVPWPCLPPPREGPAILGGGGNGGPSMRGAAVPLAEPNVSLCRCGLAVDSAKGTPIAWGL